MELPIISTPFNIEPPISLDKPVYIRGRHFNFISECSCCKGTVFGYDTGNKKSGRCSVCGRWVFEGNRGHDRDAEHLSEIFNILKDNCTVPELKLWQPDWTYQFPLPVREKFRFSFLFTSSFGEISKSFSRLNDKSYTFRFTTDRRPIFKRGACWIGLIEKAPGFPSGFKVFSQREDTNIVFHTRLSKDSVFQYYGNAKPSGQFLKLSCNLPEFTENWNNFGNSAKTSLTGDDLMNSVFVFHRMTKQDSRPMFPYF